MRRRLPLLIPVVVAVVVTGGCSRAPQPAMLESAPPVLLYPTPLYAVQSARALAVATACVSSDALVQHATLDARAPALIAAAGLLPSAPGAGCDYTLAFSSVPPSLDGAALAAWNASADFAGADERYIVIAAARDRPAAASAELYVESERGALHALTTALALVDGRQRVHAATIVDAPPIATRGLVEGYYGAPFSRAQRDCLIGAMERLRQNLYLYGPKDDPYAHLRWADPYPAGVAADLRAAAATARARLVDFAWAVSPGLLEGATPPGGSLSYASAADFKRLTDKIDGVRALGVDRFALFLDDTAQSLVYPADRARFSSPVAAHADLANRLDDYVTAGDANAPHLLFVGYAYTTSKSGWQSYAGELGQALHPGIDVLWTGPNTYSDSMRASDMALPNALLGRRVVIWDNEPADLNPLSGRSADLPDGIGGFLSNPVLMQEGYRFDSWWQVFGTVADYAWNPAAYDPSRSFGFWQVAGADVPGC